MPDNYLFHIPNEQFSLLDYIRNLLRFIPYSEQETKDGVLFSIHFPTEFKKNEFLATIKQNHPQLID